MNLHDEAMRRLGRPNVSDLQAEVARIAAALAAAQNEVIVHTTAIANLHSVITERDRALAAEREAHERTKAELAGVYAEMSHLHLTHKKELADAQAEALAMRRERNQEIAALVALEAGVEQRIYGALDEAAKENQSHCDHIVKLDAALARADALLRASRVLLVGYRDGTFPEWPEGLLEAITVYVADVDAYLRERERGTR